MVSRAKILPRGAAGPSKVAFRTIQAMTGGYEGRWRGGKGGSIFSGKGEMVEFHKRFFTFHSQKMFSANDVVG